jgi:NAD(P)H-hydrate epimerase
LAGFGWIVDALFGTGLTRPLENEFAAMVDSINESSAQVVAVDIPSGLDCDSGQPLGPTVRAHHTITFVGMKQGFLMPAARGFIGQVHFADIGAPRRLVDEYLNMRSFAWTP